MTPTPHPDDLEALVGRIADEFTDRVHRGERPDPEEYARRHPDVAEVLRAVLPAVRALGSSADHIPLPRPGPQPLPDRLGGYEIVRELGRGGMGVVYLARDARLDRVVALKVLRSGEDDWERFLLEGRAVARLRHPNIVQVYEVGEHDGRLFLVLELVPGGSLADYLATRRPPPTEAANLIERAADAVHTAHLSGIVHRDLKPANILLQGARGEGRGAREESDGPSLAPCPMPLAPLTPKVTDFGLAKQLGDVGGDRTRTGAIVGTPGYMAPEQAAGGGRLVGPAADVYALGAVLYQCLTGKPPFEGNSILEVLEQVRSVEPVPPRRLDPSVPRDLETICLKCLRKEPHERYATAAALADDLRRFREGRAILARPVGRVERAVKWVRRRPTAAAAYGLLALAVLLAVLGAGATRLWQRAEFSRGQAEEARDEAAGLRQKAENGLVREAGLRTEIDRQHGIRQIDLAHRDWLAGDLASGLVRLKQTAGAPGRGWEWGYVHHLYHSGFRRLAAPDRGLAHDVTLGPDGRFLAIRWGLKLGQSDEVLVWDLAAPAAEPALRLRAADRVTAVAFSPDGATLYLGTMNGTVERWDAATGKRLDDRKLQDHPIFGLGVGPGGYIATSGPKDPRVTIWDWADGRAMRRFAATAGTRITFAFTPDWSRVAAPAGGDTVKVWDAKTGAELLTISELPAVAGLDFDPTGKSLAGTAQGGRTVWVRDAETGRRVFEYRLTSPTAAALFDTDGRLVAADGMALRTWDVRTGQPGRVFRGPTGPLPILAVGGRRVAVVEGFRVPFVWDADTDPERLTFRPLSTARPIVFRPRTGEVATSVDQTVRLWGATTGKPVRVYDDHAANVNCVSFTPDGLLMAAGCGDGTVKVWNADGSPSRLALPQRAGGITGIAFDPDGNLLAVAATDQAVQVWDLRTGAVRWSRDGLPSLAATLRFTSDGRHLLAATGVRAVSPAEGSIHVWDAQTGEAVSAVTSAELVTWDRAFAPDGRHLYTIEVSDPVIGVWDTRTGKRVRTLSRLQVPATHLAVHPDGTRFVTSGRDGRVRVWDVTSGEECLSLRLPTGEFPGWLTFSSDGRRLGVVCFSGVVHVFDAPPLPPGDPTPVREPATIPGIHGSAALKNPH